MKKTLIQEQIKKSEKEYLDLLFQLLKQPSISTQNIGIRDCAKLLKRIMEDAGIDTRIMETGGSPVVYGEVIHPENNFTILIYGHYDVQPPEPLEEWISPPFEPTIRNGKIYARGSGDNKGQLMAHVLAIKTLLKVSERIPVNIKLLFDGEEENSSPNLETFVEKNKELLQADLVYSSDGPMDSSGVPIVLLGSRGMLKLQLHVKGADRDHHSGNKGNIAPNPAWNLIHLLNTMRAPDGKILIEGFYDNVREVTDDDLAILRKNPFNSAEMAQVIGLKELNMDGETYFRKISLEPTFNINGLSSGYVGKGHKTIIPSTATVKLDIRLVADQDPEDVFQKIKKHIDTYSPEVEVNRIGTVVPSRTSSNLSIVKKVIDIVKRSHNKEPIIIPACGATFADYVFTKTLGLPSIGVPYANADEDNHAPNENMDLDLFYKGIQTTCDVLTNLVKE